MISDMIETALIVFEETILSILPPCSAAVSNECGGWMSDEDKSSAIQKFKTRLSENSIVSSLEEFSERLVQTARSVLEEVRNFITDNVEYWTSRFIQNVQAALKPFLAASAA